jgi:hypothetical protein
MAFRFPQFSAIARFSRAQARVRRYGFAVLILLLPVLQGCDQFHSGPPPEYVYLSVDHRYLRDKLALVADRVADVTNGEKLLVLQHNRRFLKVKTPDGKVGWIEEHSVIDQDDFAKFEALAKQHANDKPVTTAKLYDVLYMHVAPGRDEQHFYLLAPNTKVSLLERASVPRSSTNVAPPASGSGKPAPVRMDDWWLARDAKGRTGWMLASDLNIQVPQSVARYSESEQMLAAYVLRMIKDPDSGMPGGEVPEYLTVLRPYKGGLPYDFDQVRVFTWSTHRHHYETAYRLRNIQGFFPVKVTPASSSGADDSSPEFSFQVAPDGNASLDPATGRPRATNPQWVTFQMQGNLIRQTSPAPIQKPRTAAPSKARHRVPHRRAHRREAHP